jgi:hypothetical protein
LTTGFRVVSFRAWLEGRRLFEFARRDRGKRVPSAAGRDGDGAAPADERENARSARHGGKIRRRKEEAIVALLKQRNVEDAARVAGIGTTTLYRWMKDPLFAGAWREARLAAYGQAGARLEQASGPRQQRSCGSRSIPAHRQGRA